MITVQVQLNYYPFKLKQCSQINPKSSYSKIFKTYVMLFILDI